MMKQIGVLLSLLLFCISVSANDIVKIEYFFNSDPGYGNGTEISIPSADSIINLDVNLPIESLSYGFNTAYFRAMDDSGKWSLTSYRVFTKMNTLVEDNSINRIEYFINTDPGYGQGTPISFTPTDGEISVDYTIDLSGLSNGFHNAYFRVRDNRGVWNITSRRSFYIFEKESNHAITHVEYFFDDDPGLGKGSALEFTEENGQVFIDHTLDIAGLDNGFHKLYIRTKDESGAWSITSKRAFFVKDRGYDDVLPNIVGLEYYISNEDTTTEIRKYQFHDPKPFIDTSDLVWLKDSLNLTFNERYNLYVRAIDEKGNKSSFATDQFIYYDSIPEGDIPMDLWIPFTVENDKPYKGNVYTGEIDNLFMFVKKADRHGYSGTWSGNIKLSKDEESLADYSSSPDFDKQLVTPEGGFYDFEITTRYQRSSGLIKFTEYPDTLQLNEWGKGEILRPYGYDWKCFDVTEDTDTLFIQTEGYGRWSTIEVFYEDINQKEDYWLFSNMGAGYAISGFIVAPKKGRYYFRYKDSAVLYDDDSNDKNTQRREYLVYLGSTSSQATEKNGFKTITELSNYNFGPSLSTFSLLGKGFSETDSVVLISIDSTESYGCVSNFITESEIIAQYDFSELDTGNYKIGIIGDTTIIYSNPIYIEDFIKNDLEVEIISRDKFRVGRYQKSVVRIKNKGNTTKKLIGIWISGIPINATVKLDMEINRMDSTLSSDSLTVVDTIYDEKIIPLVINYLYPNTTVDIPLSIYLNIPAEFKLKANLDPNYIEHYKYINENDFDKYMYNMFVMDSLLTKIDSLIKEMKSPSTKSTRNVPEEEMKKALSYLITISNDISNSPLSDECAATLGRVMGGQIAKLNESILDKSKDLAYELIFKDWDDCLKEGTNVYKSNISNKIKENHGFWKTAGSIFSQHELYTNLLKTSLNCGKAVITTVPVGKVYKLGRIGVKASTKLALYQSRLATKLSVHYKEIEKSLKVIEDLSKFEKAINVFAEGAELGITIGYGCIQDLKELAKQINSVNSSTPEDKYGPTGHSTLKAGSLAEMEHYVDTNQLFEYRIDYWNKEDATAPAAIVYIRDTLDTDFDINSVNFTEIGFLKWKVKLDGGNYFNVNVDCRPDMPYIVNVEGTVDPETREVFWVHTTLDPETMELPEDPLSGYLPPIDSTGYQIGWVDYTVEAHENLPHGTVFENQAFVNFDGVGKWGPAPPYGPYRNTFDLIEPVSTVHTLPETSTYDTIPISWSGQDDGSGISSYTVFVSTNNGSYTEWKSNVIDTTALFVGEDGNTYSFYSIAEDFVGNLEPNKVSYEAITTFDLSTHINRESTGKVTNTFINVYPNPSECCFTISLDVKQPVSYSLHVFNATGTKILTKDVRKNDFMLDLSGFPNGIYSISFIYENKVITKQIILE